MRTGNPFSNASKPSRMTSSTSSSTSLRRLDPLGWGRRGPACPGRAARGGPGLIVSRDAAGGLTAGRRPALFLLGRLEELTPEFLDPADRVAQAPAAVHLDAGAGL